MVSVTGTKPEPPDTANEVGLSEAVIEPVAVDNEREAYGRNAGTRRHYYRVAFRMTDIWPHYAGSPRDGLRIEIYETWLEGIAS